MSSWKLTVRGKGIKKASVEKLAKLMQKEFGDMASISVTDDTPPDSRADRYANAQGDLESAKGEMETLKEELESWRDGLPENLQNSSKADELGEAIDELDSAIQDIDTALNHEVNFPGMY